MANDIIEDIQANFTKYISIVATNNNVDIEFVRTLFENIKFCQFLSERRIQTTCRRLYNVAAQNHTDLFLSQSGYNTNDQGRFQSGNKKYTSHLTIRFLEGSFPKTRLIHETYKASPKERANSLFIFLNEYDSNTISSQEIFDRYINADESEQKLLDEYDYDTWVMKKRIKILKDTWRIPNREGISWIKGYQNIVLEMQKKAIIAQKSLDSLLTDTKEIGEITKRLYTRRYRNVVDRDRDFMRKIKHHLSEKDQTDIDFNIFFNPYQLEGVSMLFTRDYQYKNTLDDYFSPDPSLISYFSTKTQAKLNGLIPISVDEYNEIMAARKLFCELNNIDIFELTNKTMSEKRILHSDWHEIEGLKDKIPTRIAIDEIETIREKNNKHYRIKTVNSLITYGEEVTTDNQLCQKILASEEGYCIRENGEIVIAFDPLKYNYQDKVIQILSSAVSDKLQEISISSNPRAKILW